LTAASLGGLASAFAQTTEEQRSALQEAERQRAIARTIAENQRQLTLYDSRGRELGEIGETGLYNFPQLSPDLSSISAIKINLQDEMSDIVVIDTETGEVTQITQSGPRETVGTPVWSPDSSEMAYVALRGSRFNIYRRRADGSGEAEIVYQHDGGPIVLADWSLDGRYLSFSASDLSGGRLMTLDLEGDGTPVVVAQTGDMMTGPRFSPDGKYLSFVSDRTGRIEYFVTPSTPAPDGETELHQITTEGGFGLGNWEADDGKFYYIGNERQVMAIDVETSDGFTFSEPYPVFTLPERVPAGGGGPLVTMSRHGDRLIMALPPRDELMQIAVLDREGNEVGRIGEPGEYFQPSFSPDGSRVLTIRRNPEVGTVDIWVFDVGSGDGTPVTDTVDTDEDSPVWMPDGTHVAYSYFDDDYSQIYRKRADGTGEQEFLFRYTPGAFITLMDVSDDGRYLSFDSFGFVVTVPLAGDDPFAREPIDLMREEFEVSVPRFSPDGRHVAYTYNESGRQEVFVTSFDADTGMAADGERLQLSSDGTVGGIAWREDGRELYYVSENLETDELNDVNVSAVALTTGSSLRAEAPRTLFTLTLPAAGNPSQWQSVSADGERFLFVLPVE
jgi:Tol biopolymer transport system component